MLNPVAQKSLHHFHDLQSAFENRPKPPIAYPAENEWLSTPNRRRPLGLPMKSMFLESTAAALPFARRRRHALDWAWIILMWMVFRIWSDNRKSNFWHPFAPSHRRKLICKTAHLAYAPFVLIRILMTADLSCIAILDWMANPRQGLVLQYKHVPTGIFRYAKVPVTSKNTVRQGNSKCEKTSQRISRVRQEWP